LSMRQAPGRLRRPVHVLSLIAGVDE
jgi:hypothetical protein